MAKTPNYNHERRERERAKALKKEQKLAAKADVKKRDHSGTEAGSMPDEPQE